MHYVGISTYQFIPYYASAIHKHMHTRILKPFEDSLPTGLKVDIAKIRPKICFRPFPDNSFHSHSTERNPGLEVEISRRENSEIS